MEQKRKRGRPKGSKNKPKKGKIEPIKKKRGRPKKMPQLRKILPIYQGVSFVKRAKAAQSETHRWVAYIGNQVIGFFKTQKDAIKAHKNETEKGNTK